MRKTLVIMLGLLTAGVGTAFADSPEKTGSYYYKQVRGKKGRKYIRHFLLRKNLIGDKKMVFEKYGYTPHRLRSNFAGRITERWRYYTDGLEFVFDEYSNLIEKREILPQEGHIE